MRGTPTPMPESSPGPGPREFASPCVRKREAPGSAAGGGGDVRPGARGGVNVARRSLAGHRLAYVASDPGGPPLATRIHAFGRIPLWNSTSRMKPLAAEAPAPEALEALSAAVARGRHLALIASEGAGLAQLYAAAATRDLAEGRGRRRRGACLRADRVGGARTALRGPHVRRRTGGGARRGRRRAECDARGGGAGADPRRATGSAARGRAEG